MSKWFGIIAGIGGVIFGIFQKMKRRQRDSAEQREQQASSRRQEEVRARARKKEKTGTARSARLKTLRDAEKDSPKDNAPND